MKFILLYTILLLLYQNSEAQNESFQVTIADQNGNPLKDAVVDLPNLLIGCFTDSIGVAYFEGLCNTIVELDLTVNHLGYTPVRIQINQPTGFNGTKLKIVLFQEVPRKTGKRRIK